VRSEAIYRKAVSSSAAWRTKSQARRRKGMFPIGLLYLLAPVFAVHVRATLNEVGVVLLFQGESMC